LCGSFHYRSAHFGQNEPSRKKIYSRAVELEFPVLRHTTSHPANAMAAVLLRRHFIDISGKL
jgi:hypothetical protein